MLSKMLGGILLIVGSAIGGGILALPIVTAQGGFWGSVVLLLGSWSVMTFCAFLILEVNFWLPANNNIILMAKRTLGPLGAITAWISYLLLFYCLLSAYIAGGSDILHGLASALDYQTSPILDAILFVLILGTVVYRGIQSIDYVNRLLMLFKLASFFLLVFLILPSVTPERLNGGHLKHLVPAVTVVMTSFGFATIIPSLRVYFNNDINKLRQVILIGSLIPLFCYILWIGVILGGIPYTGEHGLADVEKSEHSTLALTQSLIFYLHNSWTTSLTRFFTAICVATSFLGVSLCVVDFLADGFNLKKDGLQNLLLHSLTFIPPLAIAILYPTAFILGLSYAGICLSVLMILLPALMVWNGRYRKKFVSDYRVMGGKLPLIVVMLVALFVIVQGLFFKG